MLNNAVLYLPLNTQVNVRAFTNAAYTQQVTIVQENGIQVVLTGSGENDNPMPNGRFAILTPRSSVNPLGYKVTVSVSTIQNGTATPSQVSQGSCSIMYYQLSLVVAEDGVDQDWNDAVVEFAWWRPPSSRT